MKFLLGFLYSAGALGLAASPWDGQAKAFEDAVKNTPTVKNASAASLSPFNRIPTADELDLIIQRGGGETSLAMIVSQLMATHPSDRVQKLGQYFIEALKVSGQKKAGAFAARADDVLAQVPGSVTHAQKAADLDGVLKDLQSLQSDQAAGEDFGVPSRNGKISAAFQFVTQWQDYLAASAAGKTEEAQNALRQILNNRQIDAPTFFPRSEILTRLYGSPDTNAPPSLPPGNPGDAVDTILGQVTKVDDVGKAMSQLQSVPNLNWDFSFLANAERARLDETAGLPITLDLKAIMNSGVFGTDMSRLIAMELLAILPDYFGIRVSDPPKPGERLSDYLDRLADSAGATGNLALLQRVLSVKVALGRARSNVTGTGMERFLGGLTQDADGQYALAVESYESALKDPDPFLPIHLVGERLARIQAAHPDDFKNGLANFLMPLPGNSNMRPGMPMNSAFGGTFSQTISVLPIPMTIYIPAAPTPPVAGQASSANPSTK